MYAYTYIKKTVISNKLQSWKRYGSKKIVKKRDTQVIGQLAILATPQRRGQPSL